MNRRSRTTAAYIISFALIVVAATVLRTLALLLNFEDNGIHFGSKALINTAGAIVAFGALLLFTYTFAYDKSIKLRATFATPATYVPTLLVSVALLYFAADALRKIKATGISLQQAVAMRSYVLLIDFAIAILSVVAVIYFMVNALIETRASVARASLGIATVILLALYSASLYFDTTLPINAPNKVVDQMAYLFFALFFLYEIRISLGRECWNLYLAFGFISATIGAYSSIPTIIYYFANKELVSASLSECVLTLTLTLFVICRVILASTLKEDKRSDSIDAIVAYSNERAAVVAEQEEIERLAYIELYNRMSETEDEKAEPNENEMFPPIEYTDGAENAEIDERQIAISFTDEASEADATASEDGEAAANTADDAAPADDATGAAENADGEASANEAINTAEADEVKADEADTDTTDGEGDATDAETPNEANVVEEALSENEASDITAEGGDEDGDTDNATTTTPDSTEEDNV